MAVMRAPGDWSHGWAMLPFHGDKAHWFVFVADSATALCETLCGRSYEGKATAQVGDPGNFPRCKSCIAALRRRTA